MKRLITLGIMLLVFTSTALIIYFKLIENWQNQVKIELEQNGKLFNLQLENAFNGCFTAMTALETLFEQHPLTTKNQFVKFSEALIKGQPSIRAFQFADSSTLIKYVYPETTNEVTINNPLILLDDPVRAPITMEAINSGTTVMQEPFLLRQGIIGTVVRQAVYIDEDFTGLVIGVIDIKRLVESILPDKNINLYNIVLRNQAGNLFYGNETTVSNITNSVIKIKNQTWQIDFNRINGPTTPLYLNPPIFFIFAGFIVFIILASINKSWLNTQFLIRSVQNKTVNLKKMNTDLKREAKDRVRTAEHLAEREEQYKELINSTIDGVIAFDSELKILLWNPAAEKLFSYTEHEMIGQSFLKLIPDANYDYEKKHMKCLFIKDSDTDIGHTVEMICKDRENNEIPIEISFAGSSVRGRYIVTVIVRNIAERKERELIMLNKKKMLSNEVDLLRKQLESKFKIQKLMGESAQINKVINQVQHVAPTKLSIIIQGKSGTGKEIVANLIHEKSDRSDQPFIAIDCGAIPSTLFESELFGYEKGAFTGADQTKSGKFKEADKGTLFLDEISNLSYDNQAKLLRVLQEWKYNRIGGSIPQELNIRLIVASNSDLLDKTEKGDFRDDLYHRLNQFNISLPELSERPEDIPILAKRFLEEANLEFSKEIKSIAPDVLNLFLTYSWPGNVRELRNVIRKAALLESSGILGPTHIDLKSNTGSRACEDQDSVNNLIDEILEGKVPYSQATSAYFKDIEKSVLKQIMHLNDNNRTKVSNLISMNRKTLYTKLKDFELDG